MSSEGCRRSSSTVLSILIFCCLSLLDAGASAAAVPVPSQLLLTVRETAGVARTGEVVRSGVPLPRSLNVRSTAGLTIVDGAGTPVPAEFTVTARWNAGRNVSTAPIQWLMVSFPATVGANQAATYRLVTDGSAGPNPAPARAITVTRNGNAVTVDTGAAIFRLGASSGSLFDEVVLDNGTRLIGGGNLSLRTGGADYGHSTTRSVVIEHQGPLSAVVVVQGVYDTPAIGDGWLSTRRRYEFRAGSPTAVVRHVANWEGNLGCVGCTTTPAGAPNGVLVEKVRDELAVELGGTPGVLAAGSFGAAAVSGTVGSTQSAWVRQQLRPTRTSPLAFDVSVGGGGAAATGSKADGAVLAASGPRGTVAISLSHMHRYEPQALRLLPGGRMAVDLVDGKAWLANHQGLFATMAVTALPAGSGAPSLAELNRTTWAPLNRPLHAWPEARWLASSEAVDEFPVGALPADLAGYDTAVRATLDRTVNKIDTDGLNGLMTFGVYPRYWGKDYELGEVSCDGGGDPTPADDWDDTFWCSAWTDYHNTVSTVPVWAFRTGEVEWLDELAFPGALRTLHTQMMQCSPTDSWFYCGQAPTGYGAYRTDFNSSHAYFENLFLYYWLTGDQTVIDILQRGANNMRNWICGTRWTGTACPADSPVKLTAGMTGRVAQQWQSVFRFLGLASGDAGYLDDFRSGFARAITQQYTQASRDGVTYGFWGGPALVGAAGTYQTDPLWQTSMYDMHYLDRFARDTGDEPIGMPALRPSQVISRVANTFKDLETTVMGDGSVSGSWALALVYDWSGDRMNGTVNSVTDSRERELFVPEKTGAAEVLVRAGQQTGNAAMVHYGRQLAIYLINSAIAERAPLGKLMGQDLTRLHTAVGLLAQGGGAPAPPPPAPTAPGAPTGLWARALSATEIQLNWTDNATSETQFRIECQTGTSWQEIGTAGTNAVTTVANGLAGNTTYAFRVRAANGTGASDYSNTVWVTTQSPASPPPSGIPNAPTGLWAQALSATEIRLNWTDNSTNETQFRVERQITATTWQEIGTAGANAATFTAGGLTANTTYGFRVRAYNGTGVSGYSNVVYVSTKSF